MKIFATYCIFIALISGFGVKPFLTDLTQISATAKHICSIKEETNEDAKAGVCCNSQHATAKDSHKEKGCNSEKGDKDCNGENDCTRTCCSSIHGFLHSNPGYNYPISAIRTKYSTLLLTHLPNPYLGKVTPPPNF